MLYRGRPYEEGLRSFAFPGYDCVCEEDDHPYLGHDPLGHAHGRGPVHDHDRLCPFHHGEDCGSGLCRDGEEVNASRNARLRREDSSPTIGHNQLLFIVHNVYDSYLPGYSIVHLERIDRACARRQEMCEMPITCIAWRRSLTYHNKHPLHHVCCGTPRKRNCEAIRRER